MEIFKYIGVLLFLYYLFTNRYFWHTLGYIYIILETIFLVVANILIYLMKRGENEKS